jgi:hypothetical protein
MMIQKTFKIKEMKHYNSIKDDLDFWLDKSPEKRVAAVDFLRGQYHGSSARLQKVARVIQRS